MTLYGNKFLMRILIVLTYYRPHTSGLTIYAERLARAFVKRGHLVTVLTSQYEKGLPREETQDGVKIVRVPILFRLSKGVIMPLFGVIASRMVMVHDVVQLHLPQFDAAGIALRGRILKKPTVITYHCDLMMPPGLLSQIANHAVLLMNTLAAIFTHRIITYTRDYAENSRFLKKYLRKVNFIPPPVVLPKITDIDVEEFRNTLIQDERFPIIGMAARFATEKGVEVLLGALPRFFEENPNGMVLFAGPHENIIGEEHYYRRLLPTITQFEKEGRWRFIGTLDPEQMTAFYRTIDVLVLPSLNSTEAFGLVQIEAMMNGVPSIASDLPGVRQPVLMHDMGCIIPIGNSLALAEALLKVLKQRDIYRHSPQEMINTYLPDRIASEYEALFAEIKSELHIN